MNCLKKFILTNSRDVIKKGVSFFSFITILSLAIVVGNKSAEAAKLADGTWSQGGAPGTTTIVFTNTTALDASSDLVFTFPSTAAVSQVGTDVTIAGHTNPVRTNNTVDNTISLALLDGTLDAGLSVTVTMTDALSTYTTTTYAQESLAINTNDTGDVPVDFGVALKTNDNTTTVTTQVPLFVSIGVDTTTIELGTLSPASINEADQTYTINSNNRTGVTVAIIADGDFNDGFGNDINAVADGAVTAGVEEYGIGVDNVSGMTMESPFDAGDDEIPQIQDNIANTTTEISNGTFDLNYKASIMGTTIAGNYDQVVTITISTNS